MVGAADRADRQRQPVVPQLADAGADPRLLRRRPAGAALLPRRLVARAERARAGADRRRARRARPSASLRVAVALLSIARRGEPAVGAAGDEHVVRPRCRWSTPTARSAASAASATSWCSRGRPTTRSPPPTTLARVRIQMQAGRSGAPPVLDEPVPLSPRLAALVRGDGAAARRSRGRCTWCGSCCTPIPRRWRCSPTIPSAAPRPATSASSSIATASRRAAPAGWWQRERVGELAAARVARQRRAPDLPHRTRSG